MNQDAVSKISNWMQVLAIIVLSIAQIVQSTKSSNLILSMLGLAALVFLGYMIIKHQSRALPNRVTRHAEFLNAQLELLNDLKIEMEGKGRIGSRSGKEVYEQLVHGLDVRIRQMNMVLNNFSKPAK